MRCVTAKVGLVLTWQNLNFQRYFGETAPHRWYAASKSGALDWSHRLTSLGLGKRALAVLGAAGSVRNGRPKWSRFKAILGRFGATLTVF